MIDIQLMAICDKHISLGKIENVNSIFKQLEDNIIDWHPHNAYFYN